uniref:Uncharacterized protein n=1 Tax=Utricularia reniformis TaxID=192314 RepID=A0A1Y0AZ63_9LAMI|nr:hypothetical protein AEK19_MT0175 [Utricularia reniformis]ART30457.1 hypothetical protein AEK19_MT0175 [Utricularia reniformis]
MDEFLTPNVEKMKAALQSRVLYRATRIKSNPNETKYTQRYRDTIRIQIPSVALLSLCLNSLHFIRIMPKNDYLKLNSQIKEKRVANS